MAKPSLTVAGGITPEVMQKLNKSYSSTELRGIRRSGHDAQTPI